MRRFRSRLIPCALAAAALAAQSCAFAGRGAAPVPCNDAHLTLLPFAGPAPGCEITGRIRIELPRYRFRGLCRILHDGRGRLRIDFEHSSLFGAIHERITVLAGDSLVIYDHGSGAWAAGDSALAVASEGLGAPVLSDDLLYALLLAAPRCHDMADPALERRGADLALRGAWRGREVELRCDGDDGPRYFKQCFTYPHRCFILEYEGGVPASSSRYPRRIRLRREDGPERVSMEVVAVKIVNPDPAEFVIGG